MARFQVTQKHRVKKVTHVNGGLTLSSDIRILTDDELEAIADGARLGSNRLERALLPTRVREA